MNALLRQARDQQAADELLAARQKIELALDLVDREDRDSRRELRYLLHRLARLARDLHQLRQLAP